MGNSTQAVSVSANVDGCLSGPAINWWLSEVQPVKTAGRGSSTLWPSEQEKHFKVLKSVRNNLVQHKNVILIFPINYDANNNNQQNTETQLDFVVLLF